MVKTRIRIGMVETLSTDFYHLKILHLSEWANAIVLRLYLAQWVCGRQESESLTIADDYVDLFIVIYLSSSLKYAKRTWIGKGAKIIAFKDTVLPLSQ